jgi:hypothetical protein
MRVVDVDNIRRAIDILGLAEDSEDSRSQQLSAT